MTVTRTVLYIGLEARVKQPAPASPNVVLFKPGNGPHRSTLLGWQRFSTHDGPVAALSKELMQRANGVPIMDTSLFWLNIVMPDARPGHDSRFFPPCLVNLDGKTRRLRGLLGTMPYTDFVDLAHSIYGLSTDKPWSFFMEGLGYALQAYIEHNRIKPDNADGVLVRFVYCLDNVPLSEMDTPDEQDTEGPGAA